VPKRTIANSPLPRVLKGLEKLKEEKNWKLGLPKPLRLRCPNPGNGRIFPKREVKDLPFG